jgi:pimeloyl-ACP methyl ester carboxylesterase
MNKYIEAGDSLKPAVVLLHGYADTAKLFTPLIENLKNDHFVLAIEFPMVGGKEIHDSESLSSYVDSILQGKQLNKFKLVGFSLGGLVATYFAHEHPDEVDELILLNIYPQIKLSQTTRFALKHTPKRLLFNKKIFLVWAYISSSNKIRKALGKVRLNKNVKYQLRKSPYAVLGTVLKVIKDQVSKEDIGTITLIDKYKNIKCNKKIVLFEDDKIIPAKKYLDEAIKHKIEIEIQTNGGHGDKPGYWESVVDTL